MVKKFLLAALVAASTIPTTTASAEPCVVWDPPPPHLVDPCPSGRACAFNSATDVTREAGWQVGQISAGPLVTWESGTLVCEIHVNNNAHDGGHVFSTSYSTTAGLVVVGETRVLNYPATAADTVSLCTEWHGASGTLYYAGGGAWSTTPTSCGESISIEPNWPTCPVWLAIDQRAGTNIAEVWQDCEPYEPII